MNEDRDGLAVCGGCVAQWRIAVYSAGEGGGPPTTAAMAIHCGEADHRDHRGRDNLPLHRGSRCWLSCYHLHVMSIQLHQGFTPFIFVSTVETTARPIWGRQCRLTGGSARCRARRSRAPG